MPCPVGGHKLLLLVQCSGLRVTRENRPSELGLGLVLSLKLMQIIPGFETSALMHALPKPSRENTQPSDSGSLLSA